MEISIHEFAALVKEGPSPLPFQIGKAYLMRSHTWTCLGLVVGIRGKFLVMERMSWVADTGRFGEANTIGSLSEVEYRGDGIFNSDAIVDAYEWHSELPKVSK